MLYRKDLKNEQLDTNEFKSFEFKELLLHSSASIIRTVFICRQPISAENGLTYALFFDEFSTLLEPLVTLVCASRKLLLSSSFRRQSLSISGCIKLFQSKRLKCQHPNSQIKVITFWILLLPDLEKTPLLIYQSTTPVVSKHSAVHCILDFERPSNKKQGHPTRI